MLDFISDCWDAICDHPIRTAVTAVAVVATGGAALAAAPTIAGAMGAFGMLGTTASGTAISSLSGAALTNASLAAVGGGSLAAGGGGMATGTTIIGSLGAKTGGMISCAINKQLADR